MSDEEAASSRDAWGVGATLVVVTLVGVLAGAAWATYGEVGEGMSRIAVAAMIVGVAAACVELVRVVGAVLGRGLAIPGAPLGNWVRVALAILLAANVDLLPRIQAHDGWWDYVTFDVSCALVLVEVVSRFRGPGLLWIAAVLIDAVKLRREAASFHVVCAGSALAVGATLVLARLRASRLARLGILPWAPSDLVTFPFFGAVAALVMAELRRLEIGANDVMFPMIIGTAIEIAALVYLDRRLRAAEARRDAA